MPRRPLEHKRGQRQSTWQWAAAAAAEPGSGARGSRLGAPTRPPSAAPRHRACTEANDNVKFLETLKPALEKMTNNEEFATLTEDFRPGAAVA